MENQNHFTAHLKHFLPLDQKQKFLNKALNLHIEEKNDMESLDNLIKLQKDNLDNSANKINKYYDDIKSTIVGFIEEHREKHLQTYKESLEDHIKRNAMYLSDYTSFIKNLKPELKIFLLQGDRSLFYKFYEKINQNSTTVEENYKKAHLFYEDLKNDIKPGVSESIKMKIVEYIEKNFKFKEYNNSEFSPKNQENITKVNEEDRIKEKFMLMRLEEDKISEKEKVIHEEKKKNTKNKLEELKLKVQNINIHK